MIYVDPATPSSMVERINKEDADVNAIFYDPTKLKLQANGFIWLNPTQEPFKFGWGAHTLRTCSWGHFQDITTKNSWWIFNTHFDHRSREARIQSSLLLAKIIKEKTGDNLAFLIGDFNLSNLSKVIPALFTSPFNLQDAKQLASEQHGPAYTFIPGATIDYFLVSHADRVKMLRYEVIDFARGGLTPSDHRALILDFEFK
jgi:endonuclease/exonuclease/phosphatase family metal-dependent hydrolase